MSMTKIMFNVFYSRRETADSVHDWKSDEPSCTLQEFRDECDINNLVQRYKTTGAFYDALSLCGKQPRMPSFADVSEIPDYDGAMEIIAEGQARFEALPPSVRRVFDNSAELFLAFMSNPANAEKATELGLLAKKRVQGVEPPASVKTEPQQAAETVAKASENK